MIQKHNIVKNKGVLDFVIEWDLLKSGNLQFLSICLNQNLILFATCSFTRNFVIIWS